MYNTYVLDVVVVYCVFKYRIVFFYSNKNKAFFIEQFYTSLNVDNQSAKHYSFNLSNNTNVFYHELVRVTDTLSHTSR